MIRFEGYDESSPTLLQSWSAGTCMGPDWDNCIAWYDPGARIFSGDIVRLHLRCADGAEICVLKRLEVDRGGFWYAIAESEGVMSLMLYQVIAVEKIVARAASAGRPPREDFKHHAKPEDFRLNAIFSAAARAEWQREGFVRGVEWPGFDAVLARGYPPEVHK